MKDFTPLDRHEYIFKKILMVDEDGALTWDGTFFKLYDELLQNLQETRKIAENLRKIEND